MFLSRGGSAGQRDRALNANHHRENFVTEETISKGGRSGTVKTPDGLPIVKLGDPLEKCGSNPEQLYAGLYSAYYHDAMSNAARKLGMPVAD